MRSVYLYTTLIFIVIIQFHSNGLAQDVFAPTQNRKINATFTPGAIKIDGRLDEKDWANAGSVSDFVQVEPMQGMNSKFDTSVKVLYDNRYLYVGAFLADSAGKKELRATDLKRDFNWRDHDTFAICIDGFNDKRNSMSFATNPYSAQKDYLSFDDTFFDADWNGLWKVRTTRSDSGWVAEFEIPWKSLRYPQQQDSIRDWAINFLRLKRSDNEISSWSPYPRSFGFNRMEYAGTLMGINPPPPSTNVQVNPYVLVLGTKKEGSDIGNISKAELKYGGEIKWAVNSNTVIDLTANTDFAQADADVQVNNISRFSVFFPEKRQFFLENASLFGVGVSPGADLVGGNMVVQPFFSRRIGLDSKGSPIPIDFGARGVYRSVKRNGGIIAMRQRGNENNPVAYSVVGRYSENIGKQNRIGGLFTLKSTAESATTSSYQNALGGIDGFFRMSKSSSLQAMVLQSHGTDGTGTGYGGYAQYLYTSNLLRFWWTESVVSNKFKPELGFVSRTDVIGSTPGFFLNYRGKYLPYKNAVRSFAPGMAAEFYHQASTGKLIERSITIYPLQVNFQNGGYFRFSTSPTYQFLSNNFVPLGISIAPGEYGYTRNALTAGSDPSRKISVSATHEMGSYYNGQLQTTTVSMNVIPLPYISLNVNFNQNEFSKVGEEETDATISLYTISGRFALNPRVQLIGLYQRNTQNNLDFYNVRVAWEFKPLSYMYVVLNSRSYESTSLQKEQTGIFKITYLKQF